MENKKAFSLVEIVISLSILIFGLVSLVTLLTQNIRLDRIIPNQLIAVALADDSLTHVQNIRDVNIAEGNPWDEGLTGNCSGGDTCILGFDNGDIICAGGINETFLIPGTPPKLITQNDSSRYFVLQDDDNSSDELGYYQTSDIISYGICTSKQTIFKRYITVDESGLPGMIKVTATIEWNDGINHSFDATIELYDIS